MIKGLAVRLATSPDTGAVARSLLGLLAMAAVALYLGSPAAAMLAAGAGAIAGASALQETPNQRVSLVVAVSLELGAAVFVGALAAAYSIVFVGVVGLWCFAAGMLWAVGSHAGLVAAAASALLIAVPPATPSPSTVLTLTALTTAAGLAQAALVAVWPPHRWRVQRDALTRAYRALAADARILADNPDAEVVPAPLTWLREAFRDGQAARHPPAFRSAYRLPERISSTLRALRGTDGRGERDDAVLKTLIVGAETLDAIASNSPTARQDGERVLDLLDAAAADVIGPEASVAQRLSEQIREAATLRFGESRRAEKAGLWRSVARAIRGQLRWTSPILRHALRLSAATAAGTALARFGGVEHGYWIALTVLMVLRPETAHTYTRCVGRVAAVAAGVLVASILTTLWHPTGLAAVALAVVFLGLTYAVVGFGFLALSASLAAALVFIIDIAATEAPGFDERLIATAIGGALAVVAHAVLPDDGMVRLRQRAGELLKTEIDYAAMVINGFVHELDHPADKLSAAWQRAFRARAAFEAASGATRVDSRELRRWLRSYRNALNAVTSSCTVLETSLPAHPSAALGREFVTAVDDYIVVLRGDPPSPAMPWTVDIAALNATNQQVRDAAARLTTDDGAVRVLVAEVETITRSVSSIAIDTRQDVTS